MAPAGKDLIVVNEQDEAQRSARQVSAARAFDLPRPARRRERRRVKWAATLVVLVLAVIGVAGYEFAANAGHTQRAAAGPRPGAKVASAPVTASSAPSSPAPASTAPASTAPASSPATTTAAPAAPPRVLAVAGVTAFGPQGTADGQNSQNAARALSGDATTPWLSDWYASPDFFDLPAGTGLLVDMGRTVTVASVRVSLNGHGASLQLRAGAKPAPAWLPVVAAVSDAGGVVRLAPATPVHVRYLLVWFTHLPPDAAGTYQASVYQITVKGQP
jgi:eukaryotic-like serine/threonine-protein kinase